MGGNSSFLLLLLLPLVAVFFFARSRKNKKKQADKANTNTDEVWATIKKYLKANGEVGKEIVDTFVAKRTGKTWKKRDVYVVIFTTKDTKTFVMDDPRALEVEVVSTRLDRKNYDRKIKVNGSADFVKENTWIAPLRRREIQRNKKGEEERRRKTEKALAKRDRVKAKGRKEKERRAA